MPPKYGLIKKQPTGTRKATVPSIFKTADDEEDEVGNDHDDKDFKKINKGVFRNVISSSGNNNGNVNKLLTNALVEDPSVFDYDGEYDSFKQEEKTRLKSLCQPQQQVAPKAKYIDNLLVAAKIRETERDRVYERKLLKERLEEDKVLGISSEDTTKFMTTAYKEKLLEDQKWQYEEKLMDEIDKRTNVQNKGMHGFYSNLLTKNISMGGDVIENAISSFTAGSQRQKHVVSTGHLHSTSMDNADKLPIANLLLESIPIKTEKTDSNLKRKMTECDVGKEISSDVLPTEDIMKKSQKNTAVVAARERYLARKRTAASAGIES